jgi:hypothetical protein
MTQVVTRQPLTAEAPFLFQARSSVNVVDKMTLKQAILRLLLFSTAVVILTIFHTIAYRRHLLLTMAV